MIPTTIKYHGQLYKLAAVVPVTGTLPTKWKGLPVVYAVRDDGVLELVVCASRDEAQVEYSKFRQLGGAKAIGGVVLKTDPQPWMQDLAARLGAKKIEIRTKH